jgi:hypothetical protein
LICYDIEDGKAAHAISIVSDTGHPARVKSLRTDANILRAQAGCYPCLRYHLPPTTMSNGLGNMDAGKRLLERNIQSRVSNPTTLGIRSISSCRIFSRNSAGMRIPCGRCWLIKVDAYAKESARGIGGAREERVTLQRLHIIINTSTEGLLLLLLQQQRNS